MATPPDHELDLELELDQDEDKLSEEPARTIGELFKNKTMVKTFVAALIWIAISLGVTIAPGIEQNVVDIVYFLSMVVTAGTAQYEAKQRAVKQAEATREVVYAPATVERIKEELVGTREQQAEQTADRVITRLDEAWRTSGPTNEAGPPGSSKPSEGIRRQTNPGEG